jgi:general stress protein 26
MARLPDPVVEVLDRALVGELTVVTPSGRPVTHPMIPLTDGDSIYMHSSALFSKKLEHIRANPKVSLAVTDLNAAHGEPLPHRVTVQGDAVVEEDDPHSTWEWLAPRWFQKEPGMEAFYKQRVALPLFWEKAVIKVTPRRVVLWEGGRTDQPPRVFTMEPA